MSVRANCPGCGAPVSFAFSSAVQTSCPFCKAIIVRHDVDLEKVGEVADLPEDASPIQLQTEGQFNGKNFMVVGRIAYSWEQGRWNEWHIVFSDGVSGWLSDAQAEYAVSFTANPQTPPPPPEELRPGLIFNWYDNKYIATTITTAHYEGFQGELPFTTHDKSDMVFADLKTADARFGTIDYSETPPVVFLGQQVDFGELHLRNLREFEGWPRP
jgi:hypothetical protein